MKKKNGVQIHFNQCYMMEKFKIEMSTNGYWIKLNENNQHIVFIVVTFFCSFCVADSAAILRMLWLLVLID